MKQLFLFYRQGTKHRRNIIYAIELFKKKKKKVQLPVSQQLDIGFN